MCDNKHKQSHNDSQTTQLWDEITILRGLKG